jgi:hypothetical protein
LGQAITKALTCWFSDDDLNVLLWWLGIPPN